MDYPFSIIEYFIVGMVGAATFLFLLLMFDKRIKLLENVKLCERWMCVIYIVFGGALSVILNLSTSPSFGVNQFTLAFGAGMGWPALAAGFSAGKKIGEVDEQLQKTEEIAKNLHAASDVKQEEMAEFFNEVREKNKNTIDLMKKSFESEIERITSYYEEKLGTARR